MEVLSRSLTAVALAASLMAGAAPAAPGPGGQARFERGPPAALALNAKGYLGNPRP